eukprot:3332386-Ditylum_brightwellii.AAC.1
MKQVDSKLYVQSATDKHAWKEMTNIPKGKTFTNDVNIKQDNTGRNNARYNNTVYSQLKKHNLYISLDLFKRNNVVSSGKCVCVHLQIVHRENYAAEIAKRMASMEKSQNDIVAKWKDANKEENNG